MKKSVKQLVFDHITTNYPMPKKIVGLFFGSLLITAIGGLISLKDAPVLFWIWVILSVLGFFSLLSIPAQSSLSRKYAFYGVHLICILLMEVEVLVFGFLNLEILIGTIAGLFLSSNLYFIVFGCIRCSRLNTHIRINDLYYYDDVEKAQEADSQDYQSIRRYISSIILQVLLTIVGIVWRLQFELPWSAFLLLLSCPIQQVLFQTIPITFYYSRFLSQQNRDSSEANTSEN